MQRRSKAGALLALLLVALAGRTLADQSDEKPNLGFVAGVESYVKASGIDLKDISFSFEMWINISFYPGPDWGWNDARMSWAFMHAGPCSYHQCLFLGFNGTGSAAFGFILNDVFTDRPYPKDVGVWTHWAGTYDFRTLERRLYRNGVLAATDIAPHKYTPHSDNLYLGRDNVGGNKFGGVIDEVRFWRDCVLAPDTIRKHMRSRDLSGHACGPAALVAHYQFDEHDPSDPKRVIDSSTYRNDGMLMAPGTTVVGAYAPGFPLDGPLELDPAEAPAGTGTGGAGVSMQVAAVFGAAALVVGLAFRFLRRSLRRQAKHFKA